MPVDRICCVPTCKNSRPYHHFHRFPANAERRQIWLEKIGDETLISLPATKIMGKYVCHRHFERQYHGRCCRNLIAAAVPTIFDFEPNSLVPDYTCHHSQKSCWKDPAFPALQQDIKGDHKKRIHRCWKCKKTFKYENDLHLHKTRIHGKVQHKCEVCHRLFTTKYILRSHAKKTHGFVEIKSVSDLRSQEVYNPPPTVDIKSAVVTNTVVANAVVSACTRQHCVVDVKSELTDTELDLGPIVFQHMDSNYRPLKEEYQFD